MNAADNNTVEVRDGTPAEFGYEFQENAGIVVMLNQIEDAEAIRLEGNMEDIELHLTRGGVAYAQAKSCMDPTDNSNASRDIKAALATLSRAGKKSDCAKLIFCTNRINPFGDITSLRKFGLPYFDCAFDELPLRCKEKIKGYCQYLDIDLSKFNVVKFDYDGTNANRYGTVRQRIIEFLTKLDCECAGHVDKALARWQLVFRRNATERNKKKRIHKKDMVWPLIVWICNETRVKPECIYDISEWKEIDKQYSKIINESVSRYELISKVTYEYYEFKKLHGDVISVSDMFARDCASKFRNEFDLAQLPDNVAKGLVETILRKIVDNHITIAKIKKATGL